MDDLIAVCKELAELAEAARTAQRTGDIAALAHIVQGRATLIAYCIDLWSQAREDERAEAASYLQRALEADTATMVEAQSWLHDARLQLAHLRRGAIALRSYGVPLMMRHETSDMSIGV